MQELCLTSLINNSNKGRWSIATVLRKPFLSTLNEFVFIKPPVLKNHTRVRAGVRACAQARECEELLWITNILQPHDINWTTVKMLVMKGRRGSAQKDPFICYNVIPFGCVLRTLLPTGKVWIPVAGAETTIRSRRFYFIALIISFCSPLL